MTDELAGIDDDELDDGAGGDDGNGGDDREPGAKDGRHVCPECGESFDRAASLGLHRKRKHGVSGSSRKGGSDKPPRRKSSTAPKGNRRTLIRESILEVLDTRRAWRGDGSDELGIADTIRRDVDLIAAALAGLAEREFFAFLGPIIDRTLGAGGPFSLFRAFAPTFRALVSHRREERQAAEWERAQYEAHVAELLTTQGQDAVDAFVEQYARGEVRFAA